METKRSVFPRIGLPEAKDFEKFMHNQFMYSFFSTLLEKMRKPRWSVAAAINRLIDGRAKNELEMSIGLVRATFRAKNQIVYSHFLLKLIELNLNSLFFPLIFHSHPDSEHSDQAGKAGSALAKQSLIK
jgi:hypothetical protein